MLVPPAAPGVNRPQALTNLASGSGIRTTASRLRDRTALSGERDPARAAAAAAVAAALLGLVGLLYLRFGPVVR